MTSRPTDYCPAVNPEEYLNLSRELMKRSSSESLRTAGDRAYYAAFLFCRDELTRKGYISPSYTTEDHEYVARSLTRLIGSASTMEYWLRQRRNRLTYNTNALAGVSISLLADTAQDIIERVKALPPKPPNHI